jgi:Zn-dependent membrane protease YugP
MRLELGLVLEENVKKSLNITLYFLGMLARKSKLVGLKIEVFSFILFYLFIIIFLKKKFF